MARRDGIACEAGPIGVNIVWLQRYSKREGATKERRTSFADVDVGVNEERASHLAICYRILGRWCIAPPWSKCLAA